MRVASFFFVQFLLQQPHPITKEKQISQNPFSGILNFFYFFFILLNKYLAYYRKFP